MSRSTSCHILDDELDTTIEEAALEPVAVEEKPEIGEPVTVEEPEPAALEVDQAAIDGRAGRA